MILNKFRIPQVFQRAAYTEGSPILLVGHCHQPNYRDSYSPGIASICS
jgi:hypothetical protein